MSEDRATAAMQLAEKVAADESAKTIDERNANPRKYWFELYAQCYQMACGESAAAILPADRQT